MTLPGAVQDEMVLLPNAASPACLQVIVTEPGAMALTWPIELTLATEGAELDQEQLF